MCTMKGWDVTYGPGSTEAAIEPHSCRVLDDCGGGFTLDEACDNLADYFDSVAKGWRERTHPDLVWYADGTQDLPGWIKRMREEDRKEAEVRDERRKADSRNEYEPV